MASIDEANLDITGSIHLFGDEAALAAHIKGRIVEQKKITATVGIASNKMVAKIAANACKPDGYLSVASGAERDFLAPLAVGVLPGVGPHTRDMLEQMGIMTVRQLSETPSIC
jgi:DNA polymerase-4